MDIVRPFQYRIISLTAVRPLGAHISRKKDDLVEHYQIGRLSLKTFPLRQLLMEHILLNIVFSQENQSAVGAGEWSSHCSTVCQGTASMIRYAKTRRVDDSVLLYFEKLILRLEESRFLHHVCPLADGSFGIEANR